MDCKYWINNSHKVWKQFIQHRVEKIRSVLPELKWWHCPGVLNPADIPSRGLDLNKNEIKRKWLHGRSRIFVLR